MSVSSALSSRSGAPDSAVRRAAVVSDEWAVEAPGPDFVPTLSRLVRSILISRQWALTCEDLELSPKEVADETGLLPIVVWNAGQTLEQVWGAQPLLFRAHSDSLANVVLDPDPKQPLLPLSVWLHAVHYEIEKAVLRPGMSDTLGRSFRLVTNPATGRTTVVDRPAPPAAHQPRSLNKTATGLLAGPIDFWLASWNDALAKHRLRIAAPTPQPGRVVG